MPRVRYVDLSVPMENHAFEPRPPEIVYSDHRDHTRASSRTFGIPPAEFHDGVTGTWEVVKASTHSATHMDAPWHYGPLCEGKPARTIDQIPLEWCHGNGVVLDFRHKPAGDLITVQDLKDALAKIRYALKPLDIVLLHTGADKKRQHPDYWISHAGLGKESTLWLLDQGVKVIGIDAFTLDRPFPQMIADFKKGNREALMPAHWIVGRMREYCQIEQLANLDQIPRPHGFTVCCFPINIARASGGWVRAVAIVEER